LDDTDLQIQRKSICGLRAEWVKCSENVRYLRGNYPMTAKPDATNAGERAMSIFQANSGVLNTERAIKLGIHPRTSKFFATAPGWIGWSAVCTGLLVPSR